MPGALTAPKVLRFDGFEVDLAAGLLHKGGVRISLREQSFQVLTALLEHPGQVVTREELRCRLWPQDVFVDFDNNLNSAIARLREALCDSADHPRFIETLPKHGYRFIAKVSEVDLEPLATVSTVIAAVTPQPTGRGWMIGAALGAAALLVTLVALNVGGLRNRLPGRAGPPRIESLAVLPLENLSRDPEQEYFADGMTEALITELCKIRSVKVISRTSAMRYKKTDKTSPQIARELGVDGLVEGSVAREGDQVRISIQLIHGPTDKHLWARSFDRELRGILALQSDVAQAIANEVRASVTPEQHTRLARARPVDPQAYEAYLKGRHHLARGTAASLAEGKQHLEKAIARDPEFALAYDALAEIYWHFGRLGYVSPRQAFPKGLVYAVRAIEIDNTQAETHALLGQFHRTIEYNWSEAQREMALALRLDPASPLVRTRYAMGWLVPQGRLDEAVAELERALELDPLSVSARSGLGITLIFSRRYDRAIEEARKLLDLDPSYFAGHFIIGVCYRYQEKFEEAIAAQRKAVELSGDSAAMLGWLGLTLAASGKTSEARDVLNRLYRMASQAYVPPTSIAWIHLGLGEMDLAFEWLNRAVDECDQLLMPIKSYAFFDPIRSDPRFAALLRRMNLEP